MICIGKEVRKLILSEFPQHEGILSEIPTCVGPKDIKVIIEKAKGKGGGRGKSEYNMFISQCMKDKGIKGFGQAAGAMKECAAQWRAKKKK